MARKKSDRIDTSAPRERLGDSPFAALRADTANAETQPPAAAFDPKPAAASRAVAIARTKKGGYAIRMERRAGNATVTVLDGVAGDAATLLRELRRALGTGGAEGDGRLELQGDHTATLPALLDRLLH